MSKSSQSHTGQASSEKVPLKGSLSTNEITAPASTQSLGNPVRPALARSGDPLGSSPKSPTGRSTWKPL